MRTNARNWRRNILSLSKSINEAPLISVIIPVYNVEAYIEECLFSVIEQTYHNIEIIIVDDGSQDKTGLICDNFADKDSRIKVIHKKNSGVAESRNVGVNAARGSFVLFVDGDDVADTQMIEFLYGLLLKNKADISICGIQYFDNKYIKKAINNDEIYLMSDVEALETMLYQRHFDTGPVAKLIKSEIVKKYPFPKGMVFEDLFTVYKFIDEAQKVVYAPDIYYYYRQNEVSMMHRNFDYEIFDELKAIEEMEKYINIKHPDLLPAFMARKFSSYCQVLGWMPDCKTNKELLGYREKIWTYIDSYKTKMLKDNRARRKNRIAALLSYFGMNIFQCALKAQKRIDYASSK